STPQEEGPRAQGLSSRDDTTPLGQHLSAGSRDAEAPDRRNHAEARRPEPRNGVLARAVSHGSSEDRGDGGSNLVGGEDPTKDDRPVLAKDLPAQGDGRWDCRDPVETVDDHKNDDRGLDRRREQEREDEKSDSAAG